MKEALVLEDRGEAAVYTNEDGIYGTYSEQRYVLARALKNRGGSFKLNAMLYSYARSES